MPPTTVHKRRRPATSRTVGPQMNPIAAVAAGLRSRRRRERERPRHHWSVRRLLAAELRDAVRWFRRR